jgi:hypothetical protein
LGSSLTVPATLDPFAHILDIGPPSAGLGSSWHRPAMLTTLAAADTQCPAVAARKSAIASASLP